MNPGPPALDASTLPLGYRGGGRATNENNVSKACILMVFKTIQNHRNIFENNVSKTVWHYLKRFGTAENIWKIWKHQNKDAYACNMPRFDTIFWLAEKTLKAMKLNGAFWRFCARRLLGDPIVLPTPFNFNLKSGRFIFLIFWDEV